MLRRASAVLIVLWIVAPAGAQSSAPVPATVVAPAALRAGPHEVVINGARLFYRVGGKEDGSPPVVFLHGGPGQGSEDFDALAGPALEPRLRMVYLDQRGSGVSERPASKDYALATLVEDIEGLRKTLGVPSLDVIAHSFGSVLGLEYAAKYPHRVAHLVIVDGLWDTPFQCRLRAERVAALHPEAYARVRADTLNPDGTRRSPCEVEFLALQGKEIQTYETEIMFPDPAVRVRIDSVMKARGVRSTGEMEEALFSTGLADYRFARMDRVTMPVLVIAGAHDGVAGPASQRPLSRQLPNARYLEFERSGHFVYLDETARFADEVTAFVRGPARPR